METKKQSSWFRTDENIKFENSFKFWFALMWQELNIQLFAVFFPLLILQIINIGWCVDQVLVEGLLIPADPALNLHGARTRS